LRLFAKFVTLFAVGLIFLCTPSMGMN